MRARCSNARVQVAEIVMAQLGNGKLSSMRDSQRVGWREVWGIVKASAERRLGRALLLLYLALALIGVAIVAISIAVMHM